MKKNKSLIIILLIVVIGLVGLTLAYFANTANITNEFKSKEYGTTVTEEFVSPENWLPGSSEPKTLTVTNSGQVDEAVRVSYTETWTSKNGDNLSLTQGDNRAAIINWANLNDWTTVTENGVGYRYYNYKLAPNETTSTLLDSVTFNKDIMNANNCVETKTETGKKVECTSDGAGYDGATYKLVFKVETVQYDKYDEAWDTNVNIAATKQLTVKGLKVNSADKTYETGDRGEMFVFSHPQTEQMKATTDYRYIGNIPNNYVYFNCDSVNNQTEETCEIWRIIGVFEVDDGTGNYETRIKLVRGSALEDTMEWDNESDDWTASSLNDFLNDEYYNRIGSAAIYGLKLSTKDLIADAQYYLGLLERNTIDYTFGTTEKLYVSERENIKWTGKVSLMYPSDEYMVYGKGVNDACYSAPDYCYERDPMGTDYTGINFYPDSGWIYNSNIKENESSPYDTWLLTANINSSWLLALNSGDLKLYSYAWRKGAVRPVVYLKPSINIISGEGTERNPYVLG